jgi:hypothetical protein
MPLIECPDCHKQISDAAPACPNCGWPNPWAAKAQSARGSYQPGPPQNPVDVGPVVAANVSARSKRILGALIGGFVLCLGVVVYSAALDEAALYGMRWFLNCLVDGKDVAWALRTRTFWTLVAALVVGGLCGQWIAGRIGSRDNSTSGIRAPPRSGRADASVKPEPAAPAPEAVRARGLLDTDVGEASKELGRWVGGKWTALPAKTRRIVFGVAGSVVFLCALVGVAAAVWADKAEPSYSECLKLEAADDLKGAVAACDAAMVADRDSKAGRAAAKKLPGLLVGLKRQQREAAAKAAEEQQRAEATRKAEWQAIADRIQRLKEKVASKYRSSEPDSICTGKGMPPYRWDYSGGTFAENEEVATSEGCMKTFGVPESTSYCCPRRPGLF